MDLIQQNRTCPVLYIVVPCYNEEEVLPETAKRLREKLRTMINDKRVSINSRILFVNDGSRDRTWEMIDTLARADKLFGGVKLSRNRGHQNALLAGLMTVYSEADAVISMDADLQDSPDEIPELYRMITEDGYDLVSGYKQKRYDPLSKTIPTKLFNATARKVSGIHNLHDFNCGLKAYRKEVVKSIEVYGEMHRYIPYLAKNAGFTRIGEKRVHHQKRKYGKSKFGLERFINGFLDLQSLWFLSTFGKKPMHFFGYSGLLMFLVGFVMTVWIIAAKLVHHAQGVRFRAVTDQPLFYLALLACVLGVMLFLAGFICEMISRNSSDRNKYNIKDQL